MADEFIPCTLRQLPQDQWTAAAAIAVQENPVNAPPIHRLGAAAAMLGLPEIHPDRITVLTSKWWKAGGVHLGVTFMDNPPQDVRKMILAYANEWGKRANMEFSESSSGQIRLARNPGEGYYSYLGTDILSIPQGEITMNLEGFTMNTPESEWLRVPPHEFAHSSGCPHEHQRADVVARINPARAIQYFGQTQGWSPQEVYQQVLTPLEERSLLLPPGVPVNPAEETSIMCYSLPGSITYDGRPIQGGSRITENDFAYMASVYPKPDTPPIRPPDLIGDKNIITLTFPVPVPAPKVTHR